MVMSPRADAPASEHTAETSESHPRKYLACVFKKDSNSFNVDRTQSPLPK